MTGADGVRFNEDRPKVRYFVPTAALGSYPHAMAFWADGKGGVALRLPDGAAAVARAVASDGEHFSFEKVDHVTRTTVRGRFIGCISEEAHHRSSLVSFALTPDALREAHAATVGGSHMPVESDEDDEAEAVQAALRVERKAVANAAAAARQVELNARREAGRAAQLAAAAAKRARRGAAS